uniref:Uncharacterized protein n=1 Tax=Tanacetum cinerariifolium TaxID=118510 RepID=A0A699J8X0_TANCI|nr:hypothetical protein [Tanacetum cinerariifolium]
MNHKNHSNAKWKHVPQAALTVNAARQINAQSKLTALKNSYANKKVKTIWVKKVNTAKPKAAVAAKENVKYNVVKGKRGNVVKASACWEHLQDKGLIDNGFFRHMTMNMSFLIDYKEIDGGYVAFGGNPKAGKITCKGTRPNWLFDIDALTKTMNYQPVVTQANNFSDHPFEQVIGDLHSAPQTRRMTKNLEEHGLVGTVIPRTNNEEL